MSEDMNDRIINRYINGEMKPSEEQEFRRLLDLDPELRLLFEADRTLSEGIRRDREEIPEEHPQIYTHFLGLLAASAPAGGALVASKAVGAKAAAGAAGSKGTLIGSLAGSAAVKAVVGTVGALGVAVGTYVITPNSDATGEGKGTIPAVRQVPMERHVDVPSPLAPPQLIAPGAEASPADLAPTQLKNTTVGGGSRSSNSQSGVTVPSPTVTSVIPSTEGVDDVGSNAEASQTPASALPSTTMSDEGGREATDSNRPMKYFKSHKVNTKIDIAPISNDAKK